MASDFGTTQPAPQGVEPGTKAPSTSGKPVTGFTEAPVHAGEVGNHGPGEAIPPSRRVIR